MIIYFCTILNTSNETGHPFLVSNLGGKHYFSLLSAILGIDFFFLVDLPYNPRKFPSIPNLLRVFFFFFIMNQF